MSRIPVALALAGSILFAGAGCNGNNAQSQIPSNLKVTQPGASNVTPAQYHATVARHKAADDQ